MSSSIVKILEKLMNKKIENFEEKKLKLNNSISNFVGSNKIAIKRYKVTTKFETKEVVVKNSSSKIVLNGIKLLSNDNPLILFGLIKNHAFFNYDHSRLREKSIYENIDEKLKMNFITYYGTYKNNIVLDYINIKNDFDYKKIISKIASIHAFYYNQPEIIKKFHLNNNTPDMYKKCRKTLLRMYKELDNSNINKELNIEEFIINSEKYITKYQHHKSLTHNDFSPRNILMDSKRIYLYDWELASYQNPEHDLIELLVYITNELTDNETINFIKQYEKELYTKIKIKFTSEQYKEILLLNLKDFIAIRLTMLRLTSKKIKINFINNLIKNCNRLYGIINRSV